MNTEPRRLRQQQPVNYKEPSSSSDESEFFETDNTNMAELQNVVAQMEALQREVNSLREVHVSEHDGARSNLQKVHIPKFNKVNPHLWFAQIERSFALCGVTSDADKFDLVSVRLEDDILLSIEDLITNPPQSDKFVILKNRLISKFAESSESKLRRLLQGGETAGMKPSEVLDHMKRLAPGKGNEAIIRTIFLGQMPESIRPFLTIWEEEDLNKLAKMADKMLDANSNMVSAISSVPTRNDTQFSVDAVSSHMSLADVCQAIKVLSEKVDKMQLKSANNNNRRQRSRSRSHSRANDNTNEIQLCWYHKKFGDAAQHCKSNCPRYNSTSEN